MTTSYADSAPESHMEPMHPQVLIAFYSRDGMTEALAEAVANGVTAAGGVARMRRAREVVDDTAMALVPEWRERADRMNSLYDPPSLEDATWADAIVLGTPSRFGLVCAELKGWLDGLGGLWAKGKLVGKVGSAFTSSGTKHGGNEMTAFTLFVPMAHFGMIIVPPGFSDPAMFKAGTPYGSSAVSNNRPGALPTPDELAAARFQGRQVTEVTRKLKSG